MRSFCFFLLAAAVAALPAAAQNPIPNADFENGITGWTLVSFNDPAGTTGVRMADTAGTDESTQALFADFQTLTSVRSATYDSTAFALKAGSHPITADISWEKTTTAPIPSVSVNRVEFRIRNSTTNTQVFTTTVTVPNQTGLIERNTLQAVVNIPSDDNYILQIFMRHSNLAGVPFICNVDRLAVGEFGGTCRASGSAKVGSTLDLNLVAPAAGGKTYYAGTSLGLGPIAIDTRSVSLSLDPLLALSLSGLAPALFQDYGAILSATGTGTAKLNTPNIAALAGTKVNTAFVAIDASAPSGIQTISNTVSITLQP